jgi:hypothetical protein
VGALPSRIRVRSWALRSSLPSCSTRLASAWRASAWRVGRPEPVHHSPAWGSSAGSRRRAPPLPHPTKNASAECGSMKYGSKTYGSKKYCSMSRQIRSAYGAPRLSCGCRQQHRRLRGSGAVPGLRASPPWPAWQALQALEAVILGRDDLAATNREASADSTPRTRAARVDNAASASTIMRASTITAISSAPVMLSESQALSARNARARTRRDPPEPKL